MNTMRRRALAAMNLIGLLACGLVNITAATAQALKLEETQGERSTQGGGIGFFFSNDSEGFTTHRLMLEYLPKYQHAQLLSGLRYTTHHFSRDAWSHSGQQISFLQRRIDPVTANGWQLNAGIFHQGRHDLFSLDASYRAILAEHTSVEVFLNRDWVETAAALDSGVHYSFVGLALDQQLNPRLALTGLAGIQRFSDGNVRNHGRIKLSFQPDLDLGLTLQARFRVYTRSRDDVGGAYFNPERYDETMLAVGWRKKLNGWLTDVSAGIGRQRVATDAATATNLLEWSLESPIRISGNHGGNSGYSFRARAGRSQSASFGGPDYRYNYVQGEWILVF